MSLWIELRADGSANVCCLVRGTALGDLLCAWPIDHAAAWRMAREGVFVQGEGFDGPPPGETAGFSIKGLVHDASKAVGHAVQGVANDAAHAIEDAGKDAGQDVKAAARLVVRASIGDVNAAALVKDIGKGAKAFGKAADKVGDTLLKGTALAAKAVDVPELLAKAIPIPVVQGAMRSLDPLQTYQHAVTLVRKGDLKGLRNLAVGQLSLVQSVASLIPGVGTGISSALGAVEGVLEGGTALDIVLRMAYGAIPIPPGLRQITDVVFDACLALIDDKGKLTDAAITVARDAVPAGLPRDVFDTLVRIIAKRVPIGKAAGELAAHYVTQYTQGLAPALAQGLAKASPAVSKALSAIPDPTAVYAHASSALNHYAAVAAQVPRVAVHLSAAPSH